jgi:hypothetical protein
MRKMDKCWRWRGVLLLAGLLLLVPRGGLAIQTTNVQGIVYRADGSLAQGTMLVSWPAFTAVDGSTVAAGSTSVTIARDGSVSMGLTPNVGANPQGTYYTVVYHMNDGTVQKEYWVVPQTATATISQMRARVVPAAVAQQSVSQQYVDTSISALQGSYLQLNGGTMSGALNLSKDPTDAMQAATKEYVDTHAGGAQLPQSRSVIAGSGNGGAVSMMEKGVTVAGTAGNVAWSDDLNAGVYDPRDPRFAGGIYGPTPAAAAQAMSNQMACDLAMGVVKNARAQWPQGYFPVDQLLLAPGSDWEGVATADGGTTLYSIYNNHQLVQAPISMTVTCSDGQSHTDSNGLTHVSHFTLDGCTEGGCVNAPGDTGSYAVGGPGNVGLEMATNGIVEHIFAQFFGGYAIRITGQDAKAFHNRTYSSDAWYYYGGYKGLTESAASAEANAATTGTTGSIALSWPAVSGATGYVIYRGSTAGGESVWYTSSTNAFTDTGTTGAGGTVTNVITNALGAPGTITATPSTTGGTLAAGTDYYKVTAYIVDGWHGSIEFYGADDMSDWTEAYGLFDAPTVYTYHHIADVLGGGGNSHHDHVWPQLGLVGIAQPYGSGAGDNYENIRVDFTRLEGVFISDVSVYVNGGVIDGSCTTPNAATINTGQEGARFAGMCNQYFAIGQNDRLNNVLFTDNNGYGPTYKTADILNEAGIVRDTSGSFQWIPGEGLASGANWEPQTTVLTPVTGNGASIQGLKYIYPADTTPTGYGAFSQGSGGQDFFVLGGNANVTIVNYPPYLFTCSGQNINLGTVSGYLHFAVTSSNSGYIQDSQVKQICDPLPTIASAETVAFSATPTFATSTRASIITLTGNVTSFTLAAGADGQEKTLTFCQNATGGFTVAAPANVRGFMTVGTTPSKCSAQHFTYSAGQTAWLADSSGVTNE